MKSNESNSNAGDSLAEPFSDKIEDISLEHYQINSTRSRQKTVYRTIGSHKYEVPYFLFRQKSIFEKVNFLNCICCCGWWLNSRSRIDHITADSLEVYYTFKKVNAFDYMENNIEHEKSLKYFYLNVLECDLTNDLTNEKWKEIGFETSNPRSEFKSGGYFSLLFMIYFVKQYKEMYNIFLKKINFVFCSLCISYYIKLALDLTINEQEYDNIRKRLKIKEITIMQFINLTERLKADQNYVFEIASKILLEAKSELINSTHVNEKIFQEVTKNVFNQIFYMELSVDGGTTDIISAGSTSSM